MKRKIREIALLTLPVIAIALVVPGARWFGEWNKARFEPLQGKPSHISGLLSIDDGWPQQIRIELPQGLPNKEIKMNLPFTAALAPLSQ